MMEYYLKTGSSRIIEVLVKAQSPHDGYLFDRLADWLKTPSQRLHSLNLFCFVVRRHPTWLFKVEKHRLIKDMLHWLKQLEVITVEHNVKYRNVHIYYFCLMLLIILPL